jgi:hypothetical protein
MKHIFLLDWEVLAIKRLLIGETIDPLVKRKLKELVDKAQQIRITVKDNIN